MNASTIEKIDGIGAITLARLLEMIREPDDEYLDALTSMRDLLIEKQSAQIG